MQNIINQTKRGKFNRCLWVTLLTWASIAIPRLSLWSHAKKSHDNEEESMLV